MLPPRIVLQFTEDERQCLQEAWDLFKDEGAYDKDNPTDVTAFETPAEMLIHMLSDVVAVYTDQYRRR